MRVLRAALIYFAIVFGAGFFFGAVRTLLMAPQIGTRGAELLESPVMLLATFLAARFIVKRLRPATATELLGTGFLALAFLAMAEVALVGPVRGISIREYLATRDPVSGTVYYLLLAIYAFMPLFVYRS